MSFVGYKNEEIPVAGKSSLKITLKEDSKALEEVVVIGYGSARKSDVTGSIAVSYTHLDVYKRQL